MTGNRIAWAYNLAWAALRAPCRELIGGWGAHDQNAALRLAEGFLW